MKFIRSLGCAAAIYYKIITRYITCCYRIFFLSIYYIHTSALFFARDSHLHIMLYIYTFAIAQAVLISGYTRFRLSLSSSSLLIIRAVSLACACIIYIYIYRCNSSTLNGEPRAGANCSGERQQWSREFRYIYRQ